MVKQKSIFIFEALASKARISKDDLDIKNALRFGIENKIPNKIIRNLLR